MKSKSLLIISLPLFFFSCAKPINKPPQEVYIPNKSLNKPLKPDTSSIDKETIEQLKEIMEKRENNYTSEEKKLEEDKTIDKLLNTL